jgi:hypothetical protein
MIVARNQSLHGAAVPASQFRAAGRRGLDSQGRINVLGSCQACRSCPGCPAGFSFAGAIGRDFKQCEQTIGTEDDRVHVGKRQNLLGSARIVCYR